MNKRGFLATLAAMCMAPAAGWAISKPKTYVWWNSKGERVEAPLISAEESREIAEAWLKGRWRPLADLEPIPADDRGHVWEVPHEHDAYVEIRIGKWRQAVRLPGCADPIEAVKSMLDPDTLLTDAIDFELSYPDSVLHTIRAESKAAVYKDLAERSCRILPREP